MKLLIQRVRAAKVKANGKVVGQIKKGLLVLVGIKKDDSEKEAEILAEKLSKLRLMADSEGKMNLALKDVGGEFLIVSQFTLMADTSGGNRPSFIKAAEPAKARSLYEYFLAKLKEKGIKVETGSFGDYMQIDVKLDGPVTIILEVP
ncbi:MAG: D-aminoacyl-tRNA deacylase [Patescibacteria group bacterium]